MSDFDGPVKTAVIDRNVARLCSFEQHATLHRTDRFAAIKVEYEQAGPARSNLRHGYVRAPV